MELINPPLLLTYSDQIAFAKMAVGELNNKT
jgi:hypothetical protein